MDTTDYIYGIRAVIEAIEAGRDIDKVLVSKDLKGDLIRQLLDIIQRDKIVMRRVPIEKINRITRKNHQGVVAILTAVTYHKLEHLVPQLYEEGRLPFIVVLDGITDVRNFGAIARTCECAGVDAIVISQHGSVGVGSDAMKTSAGALNHIPVCRERDIPWAVQFLKDNGYQIVAASEKAIINYTQPDYTTPTAIVMGAEDVGISPNTLRAVDTAVAIPIQGNVSSLNVSVAAGVMIYEVVRQRLIANQEII